jgi:hypothetical protein
MSKAMLYGLAVLCFGVAGLALVRSAPEPGRAAPPGPRTPADVVQVAGTLGLYCRSDAADGRVDGRLVLSDRPLTWERAAYLRWEDPCHPCWAGTVAVDLHPVGLRDAYPPADQPVAWGDLLLFGDPAVIRRLLAATTAEPAD